MVGRFSASDAENNWCLDNVPHLICKYKTLIASVMQHHHEWCVNFINNSLMEVLVRAFSDIFFDVSTEGPRGNL